MRTSTFVYYVDLKRLPCVYIYTTVKNTSYQCKFLSVTKQFKTGSVKNCLKYYYSNCY